MELVGGLLIGKRFAHNILYNRYGRLFQVRKQNRARKECFISNLTILLF